MERAKFIYLSPHSHHPRKVKKACVTKCLQAFYRTCITDDQIDGDSISLDTKTSRLMRTLITQKLIAIITFSLFINHLFSQVTPADSITYSHQLIAIEQQLMDDIPTGTMANWDKYLHKNFFVITEDGSKFDKPSFLKTFHPFPKGYSGYINIIQPTTVFYGNMAVINYISDEYENVFDNKIHTRYSSMNTYLKTDTSWIMVSSQVFEIPLLPPAIQVPPSVLQQYTGVYAMTEGITCNIALQHDTLYYQRVGRNKVALYPETNNLFFVTSDARGRKLFTVDKGLMMMRERRNGQDVIWKKIKN